MKPSYIAIDGSEEFSRIGELPDLLAARFGDGILVTTDTGHGSYADMAEAARSRCDPGSDERLLFGAMHLLQTEHIERVIRPAFEQGRTVVSVRSEASRFAYHVSRAGDRRLELESLFWDLRRCLPLCPTLYIVLDAMPDLLGDDEESFALHRSVRDGFIGFARSSRIFVERRVIDSEIPWEKLQDILANAVDSHMRRFEHA